MASEQIFISYRRSDEPKARLLYTLLRERGVEAWYDAKINAGEDWRTATANALNAAPIFVLLLSRDAVSTGEVIKELAVATHKKKLVVPVRLENIQLEGAFLYELASRNWFDVFDDPETRFADLADKLAATAKAGLSADAAKSLELKTPTEGAATNEHTARPMLPGANAPPQKDVFKVKKVKPPKPPKPAPAPPELGPDGLPVAKKGLPVPMPVLIGAAAAVAVVVIGGAVFMMTRGSPTATAEATSKAQAEAAAAAAAAAVVATPAVPVDAGVQPDATLAKQVTDVADAMKTAGRPEAEITALTTAAASLTALNEKAAALQPADKPGREAAAKEINDAALDAAQAQMAAMDADVKAALSVRGDLKTAESEQKAAGVPLPADTQKALQEANDAQAAIKAAQDAMKGTDAKAALAALAPAQQAATTLIALKPVASEAFVKAKRLSFVASVAASRSIAGEITRLASGKKPGVFASKQQKADGKFLTDTDVWAKERMAELDALAGPIVTADRKTVTKSASRAAGVKTELQAALENQKVTFARMPK